MTRDARLSFAPYSTTRADGHAGAWQAAGTDLHLHSTFSDGRSSAEEMVLKSIAAGYREIAITDHVRRTSDWVDRFVIETKRLKREYSNTIKVFSGIEAKVINMNGQIDARPEFFGQVDLVLAAFHRIPKGPEEYLSSAQIDGEPKSALQCWFDAMMALLENPDVDIVAHPDAILKTHGISVPLDFKRTIAQKAAKWQKVFEVNSKYQVPDMEFLQVLELNDVKLSFGSDSHSVEEIGPALSGESRL